VSILSDIATVQLNQLFGGQSFTVSSRISINGYGINITALADTGANGWIFLNTPVAIAAAKFLHTSTIPLDRPCYIRGYDSKSEFEITHAIKFNLAVGGRRFLEVPMLIADLGNHDMIIGRKWMAAQNVLLDVRNRRLLWPDGTSPLDEAQIAQETAFEKEMLLKPSPVAHLKDSNCRDQVIERQEQKFQVVKRSLDKPPVEPIMSSKNAPAVVGESSDQPQITHESPQSITKHCTTYRPPRSYDMDQRASLLKMNRALAGQTDRPDNQTRTLRSVKPSRSLLKIDIALISPTGFHRSLMKEGTEVFLSSLHEIDRIISEKTKAPEMQDDADMQSLIDRVLPERYKSWRDVFSKKASDKLAPHRPYDLKIELTDDQESSLGYSPLYKHTLEELEAAKQYITDNLSKGFIVPSSAPFASPILFARKHDGGLRFCVDYRKLNAITKKNQYPLPLIDETLERISRAKVFTKLDIRQAFHKIRIHPDSEDLTTFRTRYGSYKYKVVPFGLTNGPATFQRYINDIFMDCLDDFLTAYLDDLLIYSENELDHQLHVEKVLTRLREAGLQVDIKKCEFHVKRTKYLGFIISADGIEVDPEKASVIQGWEPPTTVRGIQSFLGFCNFYRRFIKNYGRVARPLVRLVKKNIPFNFDSACSKAFKELKRKLLSAPILIHYRPDRPTRLETDSSDGVVAAVLSQLYENDNEWHPVGFFSKTMLPAECNYPIHDKEMLAIVRALQEYRAELEGLQRKERFDILTDHRALEYFMSTKTLNSRQVNWAEYLSRFYFMIRFRPGKQNTLADALTRRHEAVQAQKEVKKGSQEQTVLHRECLDPLIWRELEETRTQISALNEEIHIVDQLLQANRTTPELESYRERAKKGDADWTLNNDLLFYKTRLVVPEDDELKVRLVDEAHKQPSTAHPGRNKTRKILKARYYWPKMNNYIDRYIRNCHTCRRSHTPKDLPPGLLRPLPIPDRPWQHISMDFRTFPRDKHGYDAVFVVVDRLSKRPISIPCHKTTDARGMARLFVTHVYRHKGAPLTIVSDRGGQFISDFWGEFCKILGAKLKLSTAFHPETDGQTEIVNQYMAQRLRPFANYHQDDWSEWLPIMDFAAACLPHESIGMAPFYVECGYEPRVSFDWSQPTEPQSVKEKISREDARKFVRRMETIWKLAKESMDKAQQHQKTQADRHRREIDFQVGDKVWVTTKEWKTGRPSKKLDDQMAGPYKILEQVGHAFRLDLPASIKVHPVISTSRLRKDPNDPVPGQIPDPPPPIEVNSDNEWEVEKILTSRLFRKKKLQYKAKWIGYDEDPEWYNAENFKGAPHKLRDFHNENPQHPGPPCRLPYWIQCWENGEEPEEFDDDNQPTTA